MKKEEKKISLVKERKKERKERLNELYLEKYRLKKEKQDVTEQDALIQDEKARLNLAVNEAREQRLSESKVKRFFQVIGNFFARVWDIITLAWRVFEGRFPKTAQFIVFFMISNAVTLLQLALMPIFKAIFEQTNLIDVTFQWGRIGNQFDGSPYYMFNYAAGLIKDGGGGGLGYFLAVQITLAIAQVINFFAQRNITFKSNSSVAKAATWYVIAYIAITFIAAAAQGLYKAPIYNLLINTFGWGGTGELFADFITMIINSAISFWVFFPIFRVIFKQNKVETNEAIES